MTRLSLARTLVSGTVTLQGIPYSFTASATGTAIGSNIPVAKKAATVAANSAAVTAARASIDKILADNSAVLSELEITSLISNDFKTTVRVLKPLGLAKIATTTDGINYFVDKETTIGKGQWLTVPNGKTLSLNAPCENYGYVQIGDGTTSLSSSNLKANGVAVTNYYVTFNNHGLVSIDAGNTLNIYSAFNNVETDTQLINYGTLNISGSGYVYNGGTGSVVASFGDLNIASGSHIQNSGDYTAVDCYGNVQNNGSIYCSPGCNSTVVRVVDKWKGNPPDCRPTCN